MRFQEIVTVINVTLLNMTLSYGLFSRDNRFNSPFLNVYA